jgi:hypothetical protein
MFHIQRLYVDFAGGRFESWFYAEGERYKGKISHDYNDILTYKRRNDFTEIVLTDEARQANGNHKN